ncbi:MAG: hypothetical protein KGJ77_02760 [Acidobacteriota bacterium]|nr:hypothetical protein [Acidobacteriota bacterium]
MRSRRDRTAGLCAGALAALAAGLGGAVAQPSAALAGTPVPGAPSCPMFPADNVWNADVSGLPVDPHSAQWLASTASSTTDLHPDFGPSGDPSTPYGMPFTVVPAGHPFVGVAFQYASESDPGPYPLGPDTPIEGGSASTGDRHAIMVDPSTCTLYELYDATYSSSGSTAGSGAIWNLRSDTLRPAGWTSADAAGLPILPGILRYDEVVAGSVTHAIRMTAQTTDTSFVWPARHEAGARADPSLPPMGARFRLRSDFDVSGFSPQAQVVLRAMQHYGLILADNGSNWYFGGSADAGWPPGLVDELKRIPAGAFEAVDESSLMVSPDSGQVRTASAPVAAPPATTAPRPTTIPPAPPTTGPVAPPTTALPAAPAPSVPPGRGHSAVRAAALASARGPHGAWLVGSLSAVAALLLAGGLLLGRRHRARRGA